MAPITTICSQLTACMYHGEFDMELRWKGQMRTNTRTVETIIDTLDATRLQSLWSVSLDHQPDPVLTSRRNEEQVEACELPGVLVVTCPLK